MIKLALHQALANVQLNVKVGVWRIHVQPSVISWVYFVAFELVRGVRGLCEARRLSHWAYRWLRLPRLDRSRVLIGCNCFRVQSIHLSGGICLRELLLSQRKLGVLLDVNRYLILHIGIFLVCVLFYVTLWVLLATALRHLLIIPGGLRFIIHIGFVIFIILYFLAVLWLNKNFVIWAILLSSHNLLFDLVVAKSILVHHVRGHLGLLDDFDAILLLYTLAETPILGGFQRILNFVFILIYLIGFNYLLLLL